MPATAQKRVQIGCLGFFNYILTGTTVDIVAVECPTWHHSYFLHVGSEPPFDLYTHTVSIVAPDGKPACGPLDPRAPALDASGRPFHYDTVPAWYNLNLIPRFTDMCDRVTLSPNWKTRPSVVARVELGGGEVVAVGRPFSTRCVFAWTKNGVRFAQPMTDGFLYLAPPDAALDLVVTDKNGTLVHKSTLKETDDYEPEVMFSAAPDNYPNPPTPEADDRLDLEHFRASLSLCDVSGDGPDWVARTPFEIPIPPPVPTFPEGPFNRIKIFNPTRVGCGARRFGD